MADVDVVIEKCIDQIFRNYDNDNSGFLDKGETKDLVVNIYKEMGDEDQFSDAEFEKLFKDFDEDGSESISKDEMKAFIKKMCGL